MSVYDSKPSNLAWSFLSERSVSMWTLVFSSLSPSLEQRRTLACHKFHRSSRIGQYCMKVDATDCFRVTVQGPWPGLLGSLAVAANRLLGKSRVMLPSPMICWKASVAFWKLNEAIAQENALNRAIVDFKFNKNLHTHYFALCFYPALVKTELKYLIF